MLRVFEMMMTYSVVPIYRHGAKSFRLQSLSPLLLFFCLHLSSHHIITLTSTPLSPFSFLPRLSSFIYYFDFLFLQSFDLFLFLNIFVPGLPWRLIRTGLECGVRCRRDATSFMALILKIYKLESRYRSFVLAWIIVTSKYRAARTLVLGQYIMITFKGAYLLQRIILSQNHRKYLFLKFPGSKFNKQKQR